MDLSLQTIKSEYNLVVIIGPTASGKTFLAARMANALGSPVISADSRQVYRELHIGCGKDLTVYKEAGYEGPVLGTDLCSVHDTFYLHQYRDYLYEKFRELNQKNIIPVLCGGTGLYLDCIRKSYDFTQVPVNASLRKKLENKTRTELLKVLKQYPTSWISHADVHSVKRIIRAIEVAEFRSQNHIHKISIPEFKPFYIGIFPDKKTMEQNIRQRLRERWQNGLKEEVQQLLDAGIPAEKLLRLGLEYKYVTLYCLGQMKEEEMLQQLEIRIRQYAKRQMTWFRKMEREGVVIHKIKDRNDLILK